MKQGLEKVGSRDKSMPLVGGVDAAQLRVLLFGGVLLALVVASALGVVYSSWKSRQLFSELQQLDREAIRLEEDWGRLLLEQSTWSSHSRIERIARTDLKMVVPQSGDMVLIQPDGRQ